MHFSNLVYIIARHLSVLSVYCLINYPRVNIDVDYLWTDLDMVYFAIKSFETQSLFFQETLSLLQTLYSRGGPLDI